MHENEIKPEIVVADDSRVIRKTLEKYLSNDYTIHSCEDGAKAWEVLKDNQNIKLLITDLGMPNMDGYELIESIRTCDNCATADIPILVITGKEDKGAEKEKVISLGATDLIGKPFDKAELVSRTQSYTSYQKKVKKLEQESQFDSLTGLVTRNHFIEQGERNFAMSSRHGYELTLVRMKMGNFEELSQQFNKNVANSVVRKVAEMIQKSLRTEDLAAYFPDAEFALLLHFTDEQEAQTVQQRIFKAVDHLRMRIGEEVVTIPFYSGVCTESHTSSFNGFSEMLKQAEAELHKAQSEQQQTSSQNLSTEDVNKPSCEENIDVSIDELLERIKGENFGISHDELVCAMRKLLPLMEHADHVVKLGLGKMIPYLKRKLK